MQKHVLENQKQWENFAKKDPLFYIDTTAKNIDQFWQKGQDNFQIYILPILQKYQVKQNKAVDFGCGIGRHTFPLVRYFQTVTGVDISEEMLKQARVIAGERKIVNVKFVQNNTFFATTNPVDFIYCVNVFQHIEKIEQIELILKNFARLLHGFAYLQFDTRPKNLWYHLKNIIPDFLLPRSQRRGIRRIRRKIQEIETLLERIGFSIMEQQNPNSEYHFFVLQINMIK